MKRYQLMTRQQWSELQQSPQQDILSNQNDIFASFNQRSSQLLSPFDRFSQHRFNNNLSPNQSLKPIKYFSANDYLELATYCVNHKDSCVDFYPVLAKFGIYHGYDTYNKESAKIIPKLVEALADGRVVLFEQPVVHSSGLLPPKNPLLQNLLNSAPPRALTKEEIKAREDAFYEDDNNWIELSVEDAPNQPFSLFHSASQQLIYQGKLDGKGHAYVELPPRVKLVDVVFDEQKQWRSWYADVGLQVLGGVRDAFQSSLELSTDLTLKASPLGRLDPNILELGKALILHQLNITPDDLKLPDVPQPETVAGSLTRGVSQFLTGFIPAVRVLKFIKPLQQMGSWRKGMLAGSLADLTAFDPHQERFSNLIQSFPELQNPITEYLQAKPDDSAAEGRLKNALEGLLLGALAEPFFRSLKLLKLSRIKWIALEVRTKASYKLKAVMMKGKNLDTISTDNKKLTETYFRVEGGGSGTQTSQNRINLNPDGSVTINSGCSGQLCVSTNGSNHASYFLSNKRADGTVIVFEIDAKLHNQIMQEAVPQKPIPGVIKDPNAPKIVDPTKGQPSISLELPKVWDRLIEQNSSKGRVLTKEEFFNEFGK